MGIYTLFSKSRCFIMSLYLYVGALITVYIYNMYVDSLVIKSSALQFSYQFINGFVTFRNFYEFETSYLFLVN